MSTLARNRPEGHATAPHSGPARLREAVPALAVATALVVSSAYGFAASRPYVDLSRATVTAARAQDVCSLVVAALLVWLSTRGSGLAHLVRLGLYGYTAYSYLVYIIGMPMNRAFLLYVVLVAVAGFGLVDGIARLEIGAFPRVGRRLERGTGWLLVVVPVLFAGLWLSMLLPFALGGARPGTEGPDGVPYPIFVVDLCVVLPCIFLVGRLLLRAHPAGGPLAVVALVKIVTLFTVLWVGTVAGLVRGDDVHLGPDAGPSTVMLVLCCWLVVRWGRRLERVTRPTRAVVWPLPLMETPKTSEPPESPEPPEPSGRSGRSGPAGATGPAGPAGAPGRARE
jgi:hypothetical protein